MALNSSEKKFIDEVANDLRVRFQDRVGMDGVTEEEFDDGKVYNVLSDSASTPVAITKEDWRGVSGKKNIRDALLTEVAAALNEKMGIAARADLDQGLVLAQAVPDTQFENRPMTIGNLKADAERSAKKLAD
ncbi:hypothetical protein [Burkholderia anthina]|uniref:hypothetical protein n=1 Tax=Burkholderia anthina TaxID=179879 RepID=UPI0015885B9A|nr:hypothetical protein [Burkholderia anthina]